MQISFDKLACLGVKANGGFQKFPSKFWPKPQQKFNLKRRFHFMGKQDQVSQKRRNAWIRIRSNMIQNSDKRVEFFFLGKLLSSNEISSLLEQSCKTKIQCKEKHLQLVFVKEKVPLEYLKLAMISIYKSPRMTLKQSHTSIFDTTLWYSIMLPPCFGEILIFHLEKY